jgi:RNA polymerase sigma-70 factor (ECF subfamily)
MMSISGLVKRFFAGEGTGDPNVIGLLYQWYREKVYRTAYYVLNNQQLAEDVVEETFLTAMNKVNALRDPAKVEAWLVRTAINKAYDVLREYRKMSELQLSEMVSEGDSILEHLLDDELREEVLAALLLLPTIYQEVVYYKFYGECNCCETSGILDVPERTVRARLKRALELITQYLGKEVPKADARGK